MNNSIKTAVGGAFGFTILAGIAVECSLFALAFSFAVCGIFSLTAMGILTE